MTQFLKYFGNYERLNVQHKEPSNILLFFRPLTCIQLIEKGAKNIYTDKRRNATWIWRISVFQITFHNLDWKLRAQLPNEFSVWNDTINVYINVYTFCLMGHEIEWAFANVSLISVWRHLINVLVTASRLIVVVIGSSAGIICSWARLRNFKRSYLAKFDSTPCC